ncbi:MAG: autotransporter outer membrane beta-barrel domain-containing protein, partial [Verrucomicrobiaceae bacterium]
SGATADIDTFASTLYGSRVFDAGFFINGQLGVGYNQYDTSRDVVGVGTAKGDTTGLQGTAKLEAGQDLAMGAITVTPLASVQYTYLDMDAYTETGVGNAGLTVTPDAMSAIDAALGLKLAYAMALADGGSLIPSVHAKYIRRLGDRELASTSSFTGATGTAFNTTGVEGDDASINVGAGLLLTTINGTDLSLNYDADIRDSLTGHTGQVKARWAF